ADTLAHRDQQAIPPSTSWLDDAPMRIVPRLRSHGRLDPGPGRRRATVLDHGLAKVALRQRLAEEAAALERARACIATGRATRLSQFRLVDRRAFDLLLDCLGAALARRHDPRATIQAVSGDGSLAI